MLGGRDPWHSNGLLCSLHLPHPTRSPHEIAPPRVAVGVIAQQVAICRYPGGKLRMPLRRVFPDAKNALGIPSRRSNSAAPALPPGSGPSSKVSATRI